MKKETKENRKIEIPQGRFCAKNCSDGCIYWVPQDRNKEGRQYCSSFNTYYYPKERNGCFRFKD